MKRILICLLLAFAMTQICYSEVTYSKELEARAKSGDTLAQSQLAYCYSTGSGIEKDFKKSLEWHKKAINNGSAYSMHHLGLQYLKGEGTDIDRYEAARLFEDSYAKGYEESKKILDKYELPEQRYDYRLIHLAEEGDVDAQYTLAIWSQTKAEKSGSYFINDENRSFYWMSKAAEGGERRAFAHLGYKYMNGVGTEQNFKEGINCFNMGASVGDSRAQFLLGLCYANGEGIEKNELEGISWLNKAANNGNGDAMFELGLNYANGKLGLSKDVQKSVEWYKRGAKAKSSNCLTNLGYCYLHGIGVEKDFWLACDCFEQAASLGNKTASDNIWKLRYKIGKKFPKHFKSLKFQAESGDSKAQGRIGIYYLCDGPRRYKIDKLDPIIEGSKWILSAADNGNEDFFYIVADIYETGTISLLHTNLNNFQTQFDDVKHNILPVDIQKARMFYEKCADSEVENSWAGMFRLAKAYYNGEELVGGVDYAKCVNYLLKVIDVLEEREYVCTELQEAYDMIGKCYYNGRGVEENQKLADEYMKKSARLGNTGPFEQNLLNSWAL